MNPLCQYQDILKGKICPLVANGSVFQGNGMVSVE